MIKIAHKFELFWIRLIGTRGSLLLILGTIWTIIGTGFLTNPIERFSKPGPGGRLDFLDSPPINYIFSSIWLVGGIVSIFIAFYRARSCEDDWGFNGVALPPLLWGFAYLWSWLLHFVFDGEVGRETGYIGALLHFTITMLVVFLSHHVQDHPEGPCFKRRLGVDK